MFVFANCVVLTEGKFQRLGSNNMKRDHNYSLMSNLLKISVGQILFLNKAA